MLCKGQAKAEKWADKGSPKKEISVYIVDYKHWSFTKTKKQKKKLLVILTVSIMLFFCVQELKRAHSKQSCMHNFMLFDMKTTDSY